MNVVIIAGGSGTRLWPLSTSDYPKHLLSLTNEKSLLQNTVERVKGFASQIFVISEASHSQHVFKQLEGLVPKENIIIEPARRGTASCVILALSTLKRRQLDDEPVFFLWGDNLTRDQAGFTDTLKQARDLAISEQKLIFIGVEPTYASTGFGYMAKGAHIDAMNGVYELEKFVEKPDKALAEKYFESGAYLWNTGYAVGTVAVFEREIQTHNDRLWQDYCKLTSTDVFDTLYLDFESEAIDYALWEYVRDGIVVTGSFVWVDVGSFKDLHAVSLQDEEDNHVKGENIHMDGVTNSYIQNDNNEPLAVIGLDNVVVVRTENGILVANKNHAQKVGEIAKKLQKN